MQFKTEKNITRFTLVFLRTVNEISIFLGKICTLFMQLFFLTVDFHSRRIPKFSPNRVQIASSLADSLPQKHLQKKTKRSAEIQKFCKLGNEPFCEMNKAEFLKTFVAF